LSRFALEKSEGLRGGEMNFGFRIADFGKGISDFELRISDFV